MGKSTHGNTYEEVPPPTLILGVGVDVDWIMTPPGVGVGAHLTVTTSRVSSHDESSMLGGLDTRMTTMPGLQESCHSPLYEETYTTKDLLLYGFPFTR